jgi:hypothetical protein
MQTGVEAIFIIFVTIWETCHCDTIAGKLENYQIIVAKEPIMAPTVGKLCFKFVRGDFGSDFEGLDEEEEEKIGAQIYGNFVRLFALHCGPRCVGWMPFVSTTGERITAPCSVCL